MKEKKSLNNEELDSISGGGIVGSCVSAGIAALLQAIWPNTHDYNPAITEQQAIWNGFVHLAAAQYSDPGMVDSYKNVLKVWGLNDDQIAAGLNSCIAECEKTVAKIQKFMPMDLKFFICSGNALVK